MLHDGHVIGIDAGGTKTRAVLADRGGSVLGTGCAGAGNVRDVGLAGLVEAAQRACDGAFDAAGLRRGRVRAAVLGVAGCATAEERAAVLDALPPLGLAPVGRVGVVHDLRVAHAGAFLGGRGAVLIVGTGACCYTLTAGGGEVRAGGWGSRLDDGGGAAWLGQQALAAAIRAEDRRGAATALRGVVLHGLGVGSLREALGLLEGPGWRGRFAALAPAVAEAATTDEVARGVLERGAAEMALIVAAVHRSLADREPPAETLAIAPVGGVWIGSPMMRDALARALARDVPGCVVVEPLVSPEAGAVYLALGMLGPITAGQRSALGAASAR